MRRLIVSADDGGLAVSSDDAILRCATEGVVRSVSVVAGGPTAEQFLERASGLDLGLHLNLTQGRALAGPAFTLTDEEGLFLEPKQEVWRRAAAREMDPGEVRTEVRAQWNWLKERGVTPSHIDGHNHVHVFPVVLAVLAELGPGLFVRVPVDPGLALEIETHATKMSGSWRRTDRFAGHAFSQEPTAEVFLAGLDESAPLTEQMAHPGSRPGSAFTSSGLRDRETDVLCSPALAAELERRGFQLTSFREQLCA